MPMLPYPAIFPDKDEPVLTILFERKHGRIPKGAYGFMELYCMDKGCDCRRVIIFVLNEQSKEKAVISMGFDLNGPQPGPFLDDFFQQAPYADELLENFVQVLNDEPGFLKKMYAHYREVREKVEGKPYRGKAFPKPEKIKRTATVVAEEHDSSRKKVRQLFPGDSNAPAGDHTVKRRRKQKAPQGMRRFLERYLSCSRMSMHAERSVVQDELRRYLLNQRTSAMELASLLVEVSTTSPEDEERINAALQMLSDALEILRIENERDRDDSQEMLGQMQASLAHKVFLESGDDDLCAAVSHALLQSRVDLLPVLLEANSLRMLRATKDIDFEEIPGAYALENLFESIEQMGHNSPFEGLETILQLLALAPVEMQISICGEMLVAENPLIRETAALMILHPTSPEVRLAASELLACHGKHMTPETLRRLIIARNWFPEEIRKNIDAAISNARRGRVECAPLARSQAATVYASPVDGAGAQSIINIVPARKGFNNCSVLLKFGFGVADAFVVPIPTKRELNSFLSMATTGAALIDSSVAYLDRRVCHALAENKAQGKAPSYWLLQVAESLGRDQWKAAPFQALQDLAALRQELAGNAPELLAETARAKALHDSSDWFELHPFTDSWFEDDAEVDRVLEAVFKESGKKRPGEKKFFTAICQDILEKRRSLWLNRLTLCALWLKSSLKPPVPWHQMFHLAEAVADPKQPLAAIPLIDGIACRTLEAFLSRRREDRRWTA